MQRSPQAVIIMSKTGPAQILLDTWRAVGTLVGLKHKVCTGFKCCVSLVTGTAKNTSAFVFSILYNLLITEYVLFCISR